MFPTPFDCLIFHASHPLEGAKTFVVLIPIIINIMLQGIKTQLLNKD